MKYLTVTADDFGLTPDISKGIALGCKEGIITSLGILPSGDEFKLSLDILKDLAPRDIGAHLALTETSPVSDPKDIPTLVADDGRFFKHHAGLLFRFSTGRVREEEIFIELRAQLDILKETGIPISHISSHEHIHMMPGLLEIFIRLAREYSIPAIRCVTFERPLSGLNPQHLYRLPISYILGGRAEKILKKNSIAYIPHIHGFLESGNIREGLLLEFAKKIPEGVSEIIAHPGFLCPEVIERYRFHLNNEDELFAVTSDRVKKAFAQNGVKLISYGEFLDINSSKESR